MTTYCLDTNAVSDLMAGEARIVAQLSQVRPAVFISVITRGEVFHGIARLPDGKHKANLLEKAARILAALPCEPVAPEMAMPMLASRAMLKGADLL
jgi:predicted nucleic acid-binding protein